MLHINKLIVHKVTNTLEMNKISVFTDTVSENLPP